RLRRFSDANAARRSSLITPLFHSDVCEFQRLLVQDRFVFAELPCRDIGKLIVDAQRLTVFSLALATEMTTARFTAVQGVNAHELGQLQEIGNASGALQSLVKLLVDPGDLDVPPEFLTQLTDHTDSLGQALFVALH